jgi:ribosomal protein L37AE/L43A
VTCTGGEPPFCCQPPLTEAELAARDARHEALLAEIRARMPRRCPSCGSDVTPLFWRGVDVWRCDACRAICSGRGD